jgi:hypothetical protein
VRQIPQRQRHLNYRSCVTWQALMYVWHTSLAVCRGSSSWKNVSWLLQPGLVSGGHRAKGVRHSPTPHHTAIPLCARARLGCGGARVANRRVRPGGGARGRGSPPRPVRRCGLATVVVSSASRERAASRWKAAPCMSYSDLCLADSVWQLLG